MVRVIVRLIVLFALVIAGVHFFYPRLEKQLLTGVEVTNDSKDEQPAAVVKKTKMKTEQAKFTDIDYQVIASRNIFQAKLEPEEKVPKKVVKKVVPTSLDLTLLGTVTGDEQTARAIILDKKSRKQDIYQIGDAVQGAFIESIDRGEITLEVNGRNEILKIKEREGGGPGAPQGENLPPVQNMQIKQAIPAPRRPRLRRNRRVSKSVAQKPEVPEPEIMPDEFFEEIDEPAILMEEVEGEASP